MTTTARQRRRLTNASAFTFPIRPAPQTLEAVHPRGGEPYKYAVVKADGTLSDEKPLWRQRAAAIRAAKNTTGLVYDVAADQIIACGTRAVGAV